MVTATPPRVPSSDFEGGDTKTVSQTQEQPGNDDTTPEHISAQIV